MKDPHSTLARWIRTGLLFMGYCTGCSSLQKHSATGTSDHAYIFYWPPPQGNTQLRVAVKDVIDMKGVVTTAGSEYRAKHSPPAARDAECLRLVRQRNVRPTSANGQGPQAAGSANRSACALVVGGARPGALGDGSAA